MLDLTSYIIQVKNNVPTHSKTVKKKLLVLFILPSESNKTSLSYPRVQSNLASQISFDNMKDFWF